MVASPGRVSWRPENTGGKDLLLSIQEKGSPTASLLWLEGCYREKMKLKPWGQKSVLKRKLQGVLTPNKRCSLVVSPCDESTSFPAISLTPLHLQSGPRSSFSSKPWFAVRKSTSVCWGLTGHERHLWVLFCTHCSTVGLTWLIGLGFESFPQEGLLLQIQSRLPSAKSTELFPWAMTNGWKSPCPPLPLLELVFPVLKPQTCRVKHNYQL